MSLGLYVSVPFCRTKCSYCNFASDVFSRAVFEHYVNRVCADIEQASATAEQMGGRFDRAVDSIYLGGGTPTILDITQLERLFVTISQNFEVQPNAEITVECAPGTLTPGVLEALQRCGVNRVSLGLQSFVDQEAHSVGRLHNRATVLDDIARLRAASLQNINLDLIAGLPHQTAESWEFSLDQTVATQAPHVSVYMLEVDEDSRLGRELIAGGTRYHAHFVPDEDATADFYLAACERLDAAGIRQYEISNFARDGFQSRHNLKYWTRQPYLGFGVDAHSMLLSTGAKALSGFAPDAGLKARSSTAREGPDREKALRGTGGVFVELQTAGATVEGHGFSHAMKPISRGFSRGGTDVEAVRFSTPDSLEDYVAGGSLKRTSVSRAAALEETFFLGLRLNCGLDLQKVSTEFGAGAIDNLSRTIADLTDVGLLERQEDVIRLTPRGRLLSNEVFERFISTAESAV